MATEFKLPTARQIHAQDRAERIRARRAELGMSQQALAEAVGTSQQTVDRIERGETLHSRHMEAIIKALHLDEELELYLDRRAERETEAQEYLRSQPGKKRNVFPDFTPPKLGKIPVFRLTDMHDTELDSDPVEYIPTPHYLSMVLGAYALLVTQDSMIPVYRPGDIVLVNPNIPARPDNDVVARKREDGHHFVHLATFLKQDAGGWFGRMWWPEPMDIFFPTSDWPRRHVIVGKISRV